MRFGQFIPLLVVAALLFAACNRDGEETPTTTVTPAAGTATTSTAATEAEEATATSTDAPDTAEPDPDAASEEAGETTAATAEAVSGLPSYEVVHRLIADDRETLVVVVEPGTYSNVELENLVYDIVERFTPSAVIVVDDRDSADLAVLEELTDEQQAGLDAHTFLRIERGVEVTFYGPYADFPDLTVGS